MKALKATHFIFSSFILLIGLVIPQCVRASGDFEASLEPDEVIEPARPNRSLTLPVFVTANSDKTVYPVVLVYDPYTNTFSTDDTWISFQYNSIPTGPHVESVVSFTIQTPKESSTLYNGEYYRIIGVSDKPYTDTASSDPPTILGVPLIIQMSGATDRPGSPSSSGSVTSSLAPPTTPALSKQPALVFKESPSQSTITTPAKPFLYSSVSVASFKAFYNPLNQTASLPVTLVNVGNISSLPNGGIEIVKQNQAIGYFDINQSQQRILPNSQKSIIFTFKPQKEIAGPLKANLSLGYVNTQKTSRPVLIASKTFYYVPKNLVFSFAAGVLAVFLLIKVPKTRLSTRLRYLGFVTVGGFIVALGVYEAVLIQPSSNILGENQQNLQATADVKKSVGVSVTDSGGQRLITPTGSTSKGSKIITLKNNQLITISSVNPNTISSPVAVDLSTPLKAILILTHEF